LNTLWLLAEAVVVVRTHFQVLTHQAAVAQVDYFKACCQYLLDHLIQLR
jgi:hypothetical protein